MTAHSPRRDAAFAMYDKVIIGAGNEESVVDAVALANALLSDRGRETHAEHARATDALARFGQTVDVLIVGARKSGDLERAGRTSLAQRLADHIPCPLFVLPSHPVRVPTA